MIESHKLFWEHPEGHATTIPCTHWGPLHNGHMVRVACTHGVKAQHTHDIVDTLLGPVSAPCIHLEPVHSKGDLVKVPCAHIGPKHSEGHPGPVVPCLHPTPVVLSEMDGGLLFYTDDALIQETVLDAVAQLSQLGVDLVPAIRPLHIFHRGPLGDGGSDDPLWSHYNPAFHSIQVLDTNQEDQSKRETLWHEMGHALLGHTPVNHYVGGGHSLTEPADNYALAMSEGWAHFVALVLATAADSSSAISSYRGRDWENLEITPNGKVEYCVGAFLWDLYDRMRVMFIQSAHRKPQITFGDEAATVSFADLFSVYSPNLAAIAHGPWVSSVWDYAERLEAILAAKVEDTSFIQEILLMNCGPRPSDAGVWAQLQSINQGLLAEVS